MNSKRKFASQSFSLRRLLAPFQLFQIRSEGYGFCQSACNSHPKNSIHSQIRNKQHDCHVIVSFGIASSRSVSCRNKNARILPVLSRRFKGKRISKFSKLFIHDRSKGAGSSQRVSYGVANHRWFNTSRRTVYNYNASGTTSVKMSTRHFRRRLCCHHFGRRINRVQHLCRAWSSWSFCKARVFIAAQHFKFCDETAIRVSRSAQR